MKTWNPDNDAQSNRTNRITDTRQTETGLTFGIFGLLAGAGVAFVAWAGHEVYLFVEQITAAF